MADQFPEKFGKYRIVKEVGRGGFADVYKAVDTTLDRTVALKFLEPRLLREPTFVERFQREAKLAANLKHPNIVIIHEFGWEAGAAYLAMEFLEGRTLKEVILEEGALPPRRIVNIVGQIASALDYAHGRGLVHRDIKPSNIMVGADDQVTVMDFGIAKAATHTALTTTGRIFGTPEYMSPEQAEGVEEPDARSDVYSLGVVVYEMVTGKVPFSGTTPLSIMRGHADKPPPRPSEVNPAVSPAVEAVLLKALAKKREARYQSAGEMAVALQQAVSSAVMEKAKAPPPVVAPPEMPSLKAERALAPPPVVPAPAPTPARPTLPWKWVAGIGAVVVVVALCVVVGLIIPPWNGDGPTATPTFTPKEATLAPTATSTTVPTNTPTSVPPTSTPTATPRPSPTPTRLTPTATPTSIPLASLLRELMGHTGAVVSVVFSPNGSRLASGSDDGTVRIWDVATGREERRLTELTGGRVAFSPEGSILAAGRPRQLAYVDSTVRLWKVSDGSLIRELKGHVSGVTALAFSPDGAVLASASLDFTVRLWRVSDGSQLHQLGHPAYPSGVAFSPDGTLLASVFGNRAIRLWRVSDGALVQELEGDLWTNVVAFSPDGTLLATDASDNTVLLWRVSDGKLLERLAGHTGVVRSIAFSPDGTLLASTGYDSIINLWRVSNGTLLERLAGHTGVVWSVAFSPDGTLLASGGEDGTVRLWRVR